jgi:hypothetical protein
VIIDKGGEKSHKDRKVTKISKGGERDILRGREKSHKDK